MPLEKQINCYLGLGNVNAFLGIVLRWWNESITQTLAPPIDY